MISDNITHKSTVNICAISCNSPDVLLNQMCVLHTQGYQHRRREYSTSRGTITGAWNVHSFIWWSKTEYKIWGSHSGVPEDSSLLWRCVVGGVATDVSNDRTVFIFWVKKSKNCSSSTKRHIPHIPEDFILQNETVLFMCVESVLVSLNYNYIMKLHQAHQQAFAYAAEKFSFQREHVHEVWWENC
jgi:hypothetical protein